MIQGALYRTKSVLANPQPIPPPSKPRLVYMVIVLAPHGRWHFNRAITFDWTISSDAHQAAIFLLARQPTVLNRTWCTDTAELASLAGLVKDCRSLQAVDHVCAPQGSASRPFGMELQHARINDHEIRDLFRTIPCLSETA
jgi:hypothetical protein